MKKKIIRLTENDIKRIVNKSVKRILRESMDDYVWEESIEFENEDFFGDDDVHIYDCKCYDGYAICRLSAEEDNFGPDIIRVTYPTREEVLTDESMADEVLKYRGLYDVGPNDITYGDIMMKFGEEEEVLQ